MTATTSRVTSLGSESMVRRRYPLRATDLPENEDCDDDPDDDGLQDDVAEEV